MKTWAISNRNRGELVDLSTPDKHGHYPAIASIWRMGDKGDWWASRWDDNDGIVNLGPMGPKAARGRLEEVLSMPELWEELRIA